MDTAIDFLYLSEPDMIKAGVKDMDACIQTLQEENISEAGDSSSMSNE